MTFGSLFAGIGGIDLGFERAGLTCKWQVEIDDYATKILKKHWPHVHRERDILECGRHNLEQVDIIAGGFPCQDLSVAGRGAGLDGKRSGLFFEAVRVVRQLEPRAVVLENVAGLLTRGLDRVLGSLASIGYDAEWHCIPAAAVGAPHIRDRIFILAYRQGEPSLALHAAMAELSSAMGNANRRDRKRRSAAGQQGEERPEAGCEEVDVADAERKRQSTQGDSSLDSKAIGAGQADQPRSSSQVSADAEGDGRSQGESHQGGGGEGVETRQERGPRDSSAFSADTQKQGLEGSESEGNPRSIGLAGQSGPRGWETDWWATEPAVGELVNGVSDRLVRFAGRTAYGIPNRVNKLRCLGNAVVPQVAEVVARLLLSRLEIGN